MEYLDGYNKRGQPFKLPSGFTIMRHYDTQTLSLTYHSGKGTYVTHLSPHHSDDFYESPELQTLVMEDLIKTAQQTESHKEIGKTTRKTGIQWDF